MQVMESIKSQSCGLDSYISSENTVWLAENLDAVDNNVNLLLQLIEEDGDSSANKTEVFYQKRPEMVVCVDELYNQYRSLAERYDHLTKKLCDSDSSVVQVKNVLELDASPLSAFCTPDHKRGPCNSNYNRGVFDVHHSSLHRSSDLSSDGGSGSSTLLSEFDSEISNSSGENSSGSFVNGNARELQQKGVQLKAEFSSKVGKPQLPEEWNGNSVEKSGVNKNCEGLLGRDERYEEELRLVNLKLQFSENEAVRLKRELEKKEVLIGNLQDKVEVAQEEAQKYESDLVSEKRKVMKLQDKIKRFTYLVPNYEKEISELKGALSEFQDKFSLKESLLQSDISSLSDQRNLLEERLEQCELQVSSLNEEIKDLEAEKLRMDLLHAELQQAWQTEVQLLKAENAARGEQISSLNRNADELKFNYDMLMAKKDEVYAQVQTLSAELISKDCHIRQLEECVNRLSSEKDDVNAKMKTLVEEIDSKDYVIQQVKVLLSQLSTLPTELITGADNANRLVGELKLRVAELEEEVDRQRVLVEEAAEEKRAAIRQLCFSLEHYRSGYQELRQAFTRQKGLAVPVV